MWDPSRETCRHSPNVQYQPDFDIWGKSVKYCYVNYWLHTFMPWFARSADSILEQHQVKDLVYDRKILRRSRVTEWDTVKLANGSFQHSPCQRARKTNTKWATESVYTICPSGLCDYREVCLHVCLCGASICLTLRWEEPLMQNNNSQDSPTSCSLRYIKTRLGAARGLETVDERRTDRRRDMQLAEQWKEWDKDGVKCSFSPRGEAAWKNNCWEETEESH